MPWHLSDPHFSQEVMLFRGDSEVRALDILTSGSFRTDPETITFLERQDEEADSEGVDLYSVSNDTF